MVLYCLLDEINGSTVTLENARNFMFQKNLLKNSMSCPGCNTAMSLVSCSSSKSPDGLIWRFSPYKKYKNIRTDSALSGQNIALKTIIHNPCIWVVQLTVGCRGSWVECSVASKKDTGSTAEQDIPACLFFCRRRRS